MDTQLSTQIVFLVTRNIHKFIEARYVLDEENIAIAMLKTVKTIEIQDDRIQNIAKARANDAFRKCRFPIVVEDAGLFIKALDGFPGPYSAYAFKTIGIEGILKLMKDYQDRTAVFRSVVATQQTITETSHCFTGEVEGRITLEAHGAGGFGFDPIFAPMKSKKTFSQMTTQEKNQYSHRAIAFRKLVKCIVKT
jgi:XTP/dITP diphosphohydrolase